MSRDNFHVYFILSTMRNVKTMGENCTDPSQVNSHTELAYKQNLELLISTLGTRSEPCINSKIFIRVPDFC